MPGSKLHHQDPNNTRVRYRNSVRSPPLPPPPPSPPPPLSKPSIMRTRSKKTRISDLNVDVLQVVMLFVAQSFDGLRSLANASSVCKIFKEATESKQVLRSVNTEYTDVSLCPDSLWNTRGMLHKCAQAENGTALSTILQYVRRRIEILKEKNEYAEYAKPRLDEAIAELGVVNTRARRRAATVAFQVYEEKMTDFLQDHQEICDQVIALESLHFS